MAGCGDTGAGGAAAVWVAHLGPDRFAEREAWDLLSVDERERARRLQREGDRTVYVRTRALLRQVLARHLKIEPGELTIDAGPHGKPEVGGIRRAGGPHFNVSHSGSVALIAVAGSHEVGVDVEQLRTDMPWREVARAFFSPGELDAIDRLAPAQRRRAFFDCWVRKEAYLKGLGTGLRRATDDFEVPLGDKGGVVRDQAPPSPSSGVTWHVHPLKVAGGHVAALAVDGDVEVTLRSLGSASVG